MSGTTSETTSTKKFQMHLSFSDDIIDKYDGFILDQFGVLHNGSNGLDGAPELVSQLATTKSKKLIILSNSSSASDSTKLKLPKLGFDPKNFVGAVTSGEEAGHYIKNTYQTSNTNKKKAIFLTWKTPKIPSPMQFIELCGNVEITDNVEEADFVILHGVDVMRGSGPDGEATETSLGEFYTQADFDVIDPILEECANRKLPMVCANPDFIMVKPDGSIGHMPGKIAQRYETKFGGQCTSFGKPHVPHFEACLRDLGLPKHRVAHVGDSLHHDIAGANATGIDSVFVVGGVHRDELGSPNLNTLPPKENLEKLFEKHNQFPTHVVPMFRQ